MAKFILRIGSALAGVALAAAFYLNFEIFAMEKVYMYPTIEPGQHVLVRKAAAENIGDIHVGDLVLFEAPFYDFDTQDGLLAVRRVSGIQGDFLSLECDAPAVAKDVLTVDSGKVRGKVILWQKKNENWLQTIKKRITIFS